MSALPEGAPEAWLDAYRFKMRGQHTAVTALCVGGAAFLAVIADHHETLVFAWACMAGIVGATWLQRYLIRRRADETVYWPWAIVGALSVGPAMSVGLHSGFAAILAWILFLGGLFRATQRASGTDRRWMVLVAVCSAHGLAFLLITAGVVPDLGNVPIRSAGAPWWDPIAQHLLLQLVYVASFFAGSMVDRRYEALMAEAEAAARKAAQQEAALAATSVEIERVLAAAGDALFAKQQVGRYKLDRLVARGGMGDVYEARDGSSDRRVAVKILRRERADDPIALELFVKEAQALARVRSPWVATVLDAGGAEDEVPYIAMEYIEGRGLGVILQEQGKLTLAEARAMVRDVARGLRDVHGAGILHRDLKPPNIMLTGTEDERPRWKIVDLGVAQMNDLVGAAGHTVAGTPMYMAPEQALGERVDARADLYSLCLVIYRALTGRPPFIGHDRIVIAQTARSVGPPDPRQLAEEIPEDVALVLRVGLAARVEDRFATASQLAAAFEAAFDAKVDPALRKRGLELAAREPWS